MHSTTLITFLLRAPSNVTSVELLGSWDNFSRPYPMERDRRMGSGHWRGCHTFTDIVRDGHSPGQSPGRTGGLKMGGTYWYYYRLDGDTEYYNDVEPVTSLCPLLPGQPVNILSVPIILPDTDHLHRRDNSNSSVKSGKRTMDPEDKYMNPRTPPKPRPGLPRLKTSPPLYQQTAPSASMLNLLGSHDERPPVSQPISSTHSPMFRLVPKPKPERSQSPPRSKGLRAALLNITGTRLPADYPVDHRYLFKSENHPPMEIFGPSTSTSNPNSSYSSRLPSPMNSPVELDGVEIRRLPFRNPQLGSDSRQNLPLLRVRRASKSSREETPLALSLEAHPSSRETERPVFSRNDVLETLEERSSQQSTPVAVNSRDRVPSAADSAVPALLGIKEKRLPTLPNSPSSVLDAELRAIEARYKPLDMDLLYSRFSDDTSFAVSKVYDSKIIPEKSRFSEWSTDAENDSPASMTSSSTFNADRSFDTSPMIGQDHRFQINSKVVKTQHTLDALLPIVDVSGPATPIFEKESEIVLSPSKVDSDHSPIFVSAPIGPIPTASAAGGESDSPFIHQSFEFSSFDDYDAFHEPNPKRQGAILPLGIVSSLPADESSLHPMSPQKEQQYRLSDEYTSQSKAIQELIDEIGYLGDLISSGL